MMCLSGSFPSAYSATCGYKNYIFITFSLVPLVSDTLDDIMTESGDEEESEGIVNKVLDEIGIEISGKVSNFSFFFVRLSFIKKYNKIMFMRPVVAQRHEV